MSDLRYEAPESVSAAVALLAGAKGTTRVLAGGTDVIVQMETELIEPELIVDIKKIPEVRGISAENGGFRVGAATTGMQICDHAVFAKAWPGVIEGVKLIGSIQVKGRASMGGNLCNASPGADSVPPMFTAGVIARVNVCTGPQKRTQGTELVVRRRGNDRHKLPAGPFDACLGVQQQPDHGSVPVARRHDQRRHGV